MGCGPCILVRNSLVYAYSPNPVTSFTFRGVLSRRHLFLPIFSFMFAPSCVQHAMNIAVLERALDSHRNLSLPYMPSVLSVSSCGGSLILSVPFPSPHSSCRAPFISFSPCHEFPDPTTCQKEHTMGAILGQASVMSFHQAEI